MKNKMLRAILKALAFFIILPVMAGAGESVPISVKVEIEINALKSAWTFAETQIMLAETTELMTQALKTKHPHWDFQNDDKDRTCSVTLKIVDPEPHDGKHEAEVRLVVTPGTHDDSWPSHHWLTPVDFHLRRFPVVSEMPGKLTTLLEEKFLNNRLVTFRKWLKETIPLAKNGQWREQNAQHPDFRIVLSLPYDTFGALKTSVFQVKGKPVLGPVGRLRALGIGAPAVYPPTPGGVQYQGLVVQASSIEVDNQTFEIGPQVLEYALGPVFLIKEVTPSDQELELFEEDGS